MRIPSPRRPGHDTDPTPSGGDTAAPAAAVPAAVSGGTIRRRIVRTLTLPVVAVLVLLGVVTVAQVENYRTAAATARAVTLVLAVQDLVQELQTERGLTAGLLGGNIGFRPELAPARKRVDDQRADVERLVASGGVAQDRVAAAVRQLDGLAGVRAATDAGAAGRAPTFAFYTGRIAELRNVDYGLDSSSDPALRRGVSALEALGDAKESQAQERAFLNGVFSASGFKDSEFLQFVTMRSAKDAALADFQRYATDTQRTARDYLLNTGAAQTAAFFEQVALGAGDGRYLQVNPQSWWSSQTTLLDDMRQLQQHVGSVIRARAATLQDQATRRMAVLVGAVVLCFAGAVYLATVASRSIARPLAALADEANRLAGEQLPEAVRKVTAGDSEEPPPAVRVPAGATDEIRSVADAFDRVQATAYALATEQALLRRSTTESLANLGRRNQNLLRRQLGFITSLEREESDPTGLANLFELDHLATRMRRNAESLLVLVGAASPRQWSNPVPIADVVRAAVAEVEEYRRVALRRVDDVLVVGSVVAGVMHMLAELVENALSFSPPDADVEVQGRRIGEDYLIAITDQGIGMGRADLELANQRLRGEGDFVTAPTRFLGHYVVGRLATEMGIDVQLAPSPVVGVTARILLPASLLADPQAVAAPPRRTVPPQRAVPPPGQSVPPARAAARSAPEVPALESSDPAVTQVLTLAPPAEPAAPRAAVSEPAVPADRRIRPETIEYVTVPGAPADAGVRPNGADNAGSAVARPNGADNAGSAIARVETAPTPSAVDPDGFAPADGERTANGLRKRSPRTRKTANSRTGTPGGAAPTRTAERPAPVNDSPEGVRARLTAFRTGVQRGSTESIDGP
ncbi:signal transduction histidine kinase [Krasilnikovia cinnamomea]|uniref:histidine kinase n=1 Tax=Krasilnikovia cinnamomea TaxID=349313 RepID=A0A4V2G7V6_9ACTN|nr:nitrate- and nitrite sensing domain-containing protein [Krasilnikovia cinnamomea]RZU54076.1 signal transduction histidine kinase [Krasilnikovia cinnamomea]